MRSRPVILFTALSVLTVGLFLLDLAVGAVRIPVGDVWAALTGGDCPRTTAKIVLNIRLIKAVVALLAGAALSVSGLQMQTLFRNPLAGPTCWASARVQASAWRSWCWQASARR